MKKAFTLIELVIVLTIIGILIGISTSTWTAFLAYLREIKYQEKIKKYKRDLLKHSKDFEELKVYFPYSLLKKKLSTSLYCVFPSLYENIPATLQL